MRLHSEKTRAAVIAAVVMSLTACKQETQTGTNEAANATRAAAKGAYVYGYLLVLMDASRAKMTNVPSVLGLTAPMDQFASVGAFPDADDVQRQSGFVANPINRYAIGDRDKLKPSLVNHAEYKDPATRPD